MLSKTNVNGKKKILIVDDSKVVRMFHRDIVESAGYASMCAESGIDGLEIFMREQFDMVVTDINMPKMDGYEFVRELRKTNKDIPVVMVTTEAQKHDKTKGFEAGADMYLVKPLDSEKLLKSLSLLL